MGNPQSKNLSESDLIETQNAGSPSPTLKKRTGSQSKISLLNPMIGGVMMQPIDELEEVPYTSFSIPKPVHQEQPPPKVIPQEPKKKKKSESALTLLARQLFNSDNTPAQSIPQIPDPDVVKISSLPKGAAILKASISDKEFVYKNLQKITLMDPAPVFDIFVDLQATLQSHGGIVAKTQRDLADQMIVVERTCAAALVLLDDQVQKLAVLEEGSKYIDGLCWSIYETNSALKDAVQRIEALCDLLPDELQMNEPVPMPMLIVEKESDSQELLRLLGVTESSTRGMVWARQIGNRLGITRHHFMKHLEHVKFKLKAKNAQKNNPTDNNTTAEVDEDPEFYNLCRLITLDVPRTILLPARDNNANNNPNPTKAKLIQDIQKRFSDSLVDILQAYVVYNPSVGYSQGMSYVAFVLLLLLNMDKYQAFVAFANLIDNHFFTSMYKLDLKEISKHISVYDLLFSENLPQLHAKFRQLKIFPEHYLLGWFGTMFGKVFPFDVVLLCWDQYMQQGVLYLIKIALGVLRVNQNKLNASQFEDCIQFLKELPKETDPQELFESIQAINISLQAYNALVESSN